MGNVVAFRRARLSGFLPPEDPDLWAQRHAERVDRDRLISLIGFAKKGAPPAEIERPSFADLRSQSSAPPANDAPPDCA